MARYKLISACCPVLVTFMLGVARLCAAPAATDAQITRPVDLTRTANEVAQQVAIEQRLAARIKATPRFMSALQAAEFLRQQGIPVFLNHVAIEEEGAVDIHVAAEIPFEGGTLKEFVARVCHVLQLDWIFQGATLWITTRTDALERPEVKLYDVSQLVVKVPVRHYVGGSMMRGADYYSYGGGSDYDFDTLIELIEKTVRVETWDYAGGTGSIVPYILGERRYLVISQSRASQEEVGICLEKMSQIAARTGGDTARESIRATARLRQTTRESLRAVRQIN